MLTSPRPIEPDYESPAARSKRWRREAESALREACTNEIGFRRILHCYADTSEDNPGSWSGSASIEIFNAVGGVEEKRIEYKAGFMFGKISFHKPRVDPMVEYTNSLRKAGLL